MITPIFKAKDFVSVTVLLLRQEMITIAKNHNDYLRDIQVELMKLRIR